MTSDTTTGPLASAQPVPGAQLRHWASTLPVIEDGWVTGLQITVRVRDTYAVVASWTIDGGDAGTTAADASLRERGWHRARPWEAGDKHGLVCWLALVD